MIRKINNDYYVRIMSKIHRMTREPVNNDDMQLEVGSLSLFYLRFLGLYFFARYVDYAAFK
jgi:hypothetical protein